MNIILSKNTKKIFSKRIFFLYLITMFFLKKKKNKNVKKNYKKIIFNNKIEKYLIKIIIKKYE
ncbi:hypothetical protein [Candidatus Carsonella ruddii]|uniref:Uncharacterized protein n=1 Tax=Carsonella ruddii TaxID=114186 RepID=A0A1U9RR84_CARRU|nr:hypothetical protein [Candidatus Carsonella ruddii]AQU89424.1 hypothetical protein BW244_0006 [Candidatus Carsonella ruddii]